MPPEIFVNTYQLYKRNTDKLAKWLLETAEQCGWEINFYQDTPDGSAHGRSKRSKRKNSQPKLPAATAEGLTFRIRLSHLIELATIIAESKHIKIPEAVIKLVQETVELRKRFSEFYDRQASHASKNVDKPSHSRHLFFIQTLEKVLELLQRDGGSKESKKSGGDGAPHEPTEETRIDHSIMTNGFANLELEELIELAPEVPKNDTLGPKASPKPDRKVVYDADAATDEEILFAIFCIVEDYQKIRIHLQKIWWNYKLGKTDLVVASVITNTAFDLVRRTDEEFHRAFPKFQNSCQIGSVFYLYFCAVRCTDPDYSEAPGDWFNYEMADIAQLCYVPTEYLLNAFCNVLQPDTIPQLKKGAFGFYDPKVPRNKLSFREKLAEDKVIMLEILPEFCLLAQSQIHYFGEDELTRGLGHMYRTKKPTLWLCFAMQAFLDIHHVLREEVGKAHGELQAAGHAAKSLLEKTHSTAARPRLWPRLNDILFRNTLVYVQEWVIDDALDSMRRHFYKSAYGRGGGVDPYSLMLQHPLLCGLTKFSLMILMRETGIAVSMAWGSILCMAHLYNALRQFALLKVEWPAIETFISINTPETLFVGGLPTTLENCVKKYDLMMGIAPEFFAKDRNARKGIKSNAGNNSLPLSKRGPRDWAHESPIIKIFRQRYIAQGCVNWTFENIESLLSETSTVDTRQQATQNRWKKSHQLSSLQLLSSLQDAMAVESSGLNYDYLGMHHQCMDVLHALKSRLHEKLLEYFGPEYMTREDQLSHIVGYVLTISLGNQKVARSISDARGEMWRSRMLSVATEVIEEAIKAGGDQHRKSQDKADNHEEEYLKEERREGT